MNIKEFINYIINFNNIDDILDNYQTQSDKGFIFERLFDIVIKFGFCNIFSRSIFNHMIGNSNNGKLKVLENINQYLDEKIISGNSGGCSDITLQNKDNNEYIFISSKYPKSKEDIKKEKSVDYYDIQKIIAMIDDNKDIYKNYKIYLVVPNKNRVLDKVKSANKSSNYITKYMHEDNILDKYDLNKYFLAFKEDIIKNQNEDWQSIYLNCKENLNLRFHQELITQKTSLLIEEGNKSFLWGCKCRSGKTYMIGGIINKQFNIKQKLNVLIITPAPTETSPQFTNDLFHKFKDFDKFKIHHIEGSDMINKIKLSENNIFVMSKQLLHKYINDKTIMIIKNLKLDIIGFDENHYTGTTDKSKDILNSYSSKNTVKILLTATYNKSLKEWDILPECQMFWDIEDEQICKSILINENNLDKLKEKHGNKYIDKTITYYTNLGLSINDIFKSYEKMPDLHLITNMFDSQRYEILKEKLNNENKMGFCFDTLFGLNENKNKFSFENEVKTFLRYISGSNKEEDGDKTIFTRINYICSEKNCRNPFTQIWFLPPNNINEISLCLEKLMKQDLILKKYDIMCINSKNDNLAKDVKDEINKKEIEAKSRGKLGLILLAGNMLKLGITLNLCDVVILLNNSLSSDTVFQQMYRCMTEGDNKKIGIVVDLNISRVLTTCINYTIYKNEKNINDKINYLIKNNLINIDVDMMLNKKIDAEYIIKKIMDIWKEDPINSFNSLMRRLDNDCEEFDNPTQKLINKFFAESTKNNIVGATIIFKDTEDDVQELPTGKQKINHSEEDSNYSEKSDDDDKEYEKQISFTKNVLKQIIPLTCILTIKNSNMDFVRMLNDIKENPELLNTFDDQCLIWWNKKGLIDFIKDIVDKYFDKTSNTYNISIQLKMSLQCLIDNPKELLELISECLIPKEMEKKKFGEVFTPINFINDKMLKEIENYWMNKYNENIYTNDKLTWYDPAAGMGNYPIAIYYKLMDGLKEKIPNYIERKTHIIEKQLYMGELNKKNNLIIKQIFNINNDFKLNLYEGNTLEIDINKVYGINKFDIIIGNPPYNEELKESGAKPLYNKFIEYYIDKCNLLSFIVPSRWFAGGKGLDKFREMMINRTDIIYINNYNDARKIFGNTVSIEGGVNYFLIDKNYNGLCDYNGSKVKLNTFDIILDSKYYEIVNKITKYNNITDIYHGQGHFNIKTNNDNFTDKSSDNKSLIKCYVSQQKGFIKYIDKQYIKNDITTYKVITARANGGNGCFGNMFIGYPNEICSQSYILFEVKTEIEAKSLLSYMKCKLPNFMLSLRKISQDISEATCKWIPLPILDREWNNEEVYKYFKLSEDDIKLIKETNINGYYENEFKIINDKKKKYYLIDNKVYLINKDKSQGELFGNYIDNKIIELKIVKYKEKKEYILENNILYKIKIDENKNIIKGSKCGLFHNGNITQYPKKDKN